MSKDGLCVIVTGSASGLGAATAGILARGGARIVVNYSNSKAEAEKTAELCRKAGAAEVVVVQGDVARDEDCRKIVAAAQGWGRLDALVNNAGVAVFAPLLETSDADWNRILAVNLSGPFICTKAAVPLLREAGSGAVVNITSISAVRASTLRAAYGTSKAGLAHLTKQLAVELASLGIRVNGVAPGPVDTAMARAVHTPEIRADYHDAIPLNRYGLEEELAEAIFFLSSDRSSYITGQILGVNGGRNT